MKRLILSSLIILTSCSTEKNELPVEIKSNNKISSLSYDNNKPPTLSPLSKSILIIENESTSNEERQQQIDKIAALSNNSDALFYLAALYEEGKLVPLSEVKARKLYQQAATMDHPLARYYYALMLIDGRGGNVMHDEAESYLLMNHNKGHIPSSYSLGYLYFIQKKHQDVIKTLEKNSEQHNEYSAYLLAISYLELNIKLQQQLIYYTFRQKKITNFHI
ncbi:tetratricopeptide repeat protein [Photobacterium aquimaris]|uniref:tetratricopeptide repeat protein n=1 Tax=Photobacterium aquimaris TaxID=512643 RepID=UPI001F0C9437|nr:tetratricopeptide repeat protein [Photobacterium aquimaris]